jgi:hypothetical protein
MRLLHMIIFFLALGSALAQTAPGNETALGADFRGERGRFDTSCLGKSPDEQTANSLPPDSQGGSFFDCADLLFTDHPLHIAVGSLAPQNGVAAGLAFVAHHDALRWLLNWDVDAVASNNGSWRAGAYMTIIRTTAPQIEPHITVRTGETPATAANQKPIKSKLKVAPYPVFNIYAQGISLNKLGFFGLGENTSTAGRSFFGQTQTIVGGNAIYPIGWTGKLNLSLLGEVNGRFVDIRSASGQSSPSIEALYNPVTAPGLASQPGFLQFSEGLRIRPEFQYLYLDYLGEFQQYVAPGNSTFSFRRLNVDLSHQIPLYGHSKAKTSANGAPPPVAGAAVSIAELTTPDLREKNGPDTCSTQERDLSCPSIKSTICSENPVTHKCEEVKSAVSRNREGSLGLRLFLSESIASGGSVVPFYFDPTLGGSDINGNLALPSYQDYRFRAPNILLFQETLDHSLYGPVGLTLMADQGEAGLTRGDIDFTHMRHSFAAGLNIRAGGLPAISLLFAWGGTEGSHTIATISPSLLPGSPRPSLF